MTREDLAQPWRNLDVHLRPWRIVAKCRGATAALTADEVLNACAALELGCEPQRSVQAAIIHRAKGRRAALPWTDLVDAAPGLRSRDAAPGLTSLADSLAQCGVTFVRCEYAKVTS